ncbi:MAG: hypothetical protein ACRD4K_13600, partial [Candidatus Acidiferrales bacterium]
NGVAEYVRALINSLEQLHIRNGSLLGPDEIPQENSGQIELSLAIHPDDRAKLASAIEMLSEGGYRLVHELNSGARVSTLTFAWFENLALKTARVDLVFEAPKSRIKVRNSWIADSEAAFTCILLKCVAKQSLGPQDERRARVLAERLGRTRAEGIASELFGTRAAERVAAACRAGGLQKLLEQLQRSFVRNRWQHNPGAALSSCWSNARLRFRRWSRPDGLALVLLGPDGVGKSTLVNGMMSSLGPIFKGVNVSHWRPGVVVPIRDGDKSAENPHDDPPRSAFVSTLYLLGFCLDFWVGHAVRIRPQLTRSEFVIFDRYYYDLLVDQVRYRYSGSKGLLRFLLRFIPKRDQVILILDAPENVILSRKRQLTLAELQRQRVAYRGLTTTLSNAHIIETQHGIEPALSAACRVATEYMSQRLESRRAKPALHHTLQIQEGSL